MSPVEYALQYRSAKLIKDIAKLECPHHHHNPIPPIPIPSTVPEDVWREPDPPGAAEQDAR